MCIAIVRPANQKFDHDILARCYQRNPDGCGLAFIQDGKVLIEKGKVGFDVFWERLNQIQNENEGPMLVHFRVRSAGIIDNDNCHPFTIDDQHALIHNGTLWNFTAYDSPISDTRRFIDYILKPMFADYPDFYKTKYGHYVLEETIGGLNKIAILNANGTVDILNEKAGEWAGNIWYSNKSYLPPAPVVKKKEKKWGHNHQKIAKPDFYIVKETGEIPNQTKINELCHKFGGKGKGKKLKRLVRKGILIKGYGKLEDVSEVIECVRFYKKKENVAVTV